MKRSLFIVALCVMVFLWPGCKEPGSTGPIDPSKPDYTHMTKDTTVWSFKGEIEKLVPSDEATALRSKSPTPSSNPIGGVYQVPTSGRQFPIGVVNTMSDIQFRFGLLPPKPEPFALDAALTDGYRFRLTNVKANLTSDPNNSVRLRDVRMVDYRDASSGAVNRMGPYYFVEVDNGKLVSSETSDNVGAIINFKAFGIPADAFAKIRTSNSFMLVDSSNSFVQYSIMYYDASDKSWNYTALGVANEEFYLEVTYMNSGFRVIYDKDIRYQVNDLDGNWRIGWTQVVERRVWPDLHNRWTNQPWWANAIKFTKVGWNWGAVQMYDNRTTGGSGSDTIIIHPQPPIINLVPVIKPQTQYSGFVKINLTARPDMIYQNRRNDYKR